MDFTLVKIYYRIQSSIPKDRYNWFIIFLNSSPISISIRKDFKYAIFSINYKQSRNQSKV